MIEACKNIRRDILRVSHQSGHGHIPSCFSVVELLYAVYACIKHRPADPYAPDRDIFILSKGHAALTQYCVLAHHGYFRGETISSFGHCGSIFGCHADRRKIPGVEASTGSLGHGIGLAVGMALAFKIQKVNRRVVTLIGDGEANEGTVWEAVMVAVNLKLNNLTILYDNNMSHARGLQITQPSQCFTAFGCETTSVDGHDVESIKSALSRPSDRVKVVVADTKKGFGAKTLIDNHHEWHRKSPNDEQLQQLLKELDA